jgi:hypothetical protein
MRTYLLGLSYKLLLKKGKGKGTGKVCPRSGHEDPEEE